MAYTANTARLSCTFLLCIGYLQYFCSGVDEIRSGQWIHDDGTELVSAGDIFRLGFFTPSGTRKNRYVGIWYSSSSNVIVWVANRDKPISSNGSGTFGIDSSDGNFKVSDNISNDTYFSTNLDSSTYSSKPDLMNAKLNDSGNLFLTYNQSDILWESFKQPTDTFLPGMKMDDNLNLTSWLTVEDPASGNFIFKVDTSVRRGYLIMNGSETHWRSGGESTTKSFIPKQMYSQAATLLLSDNVPKPIPSIYGKSSVSDQVNNSRLLIRADGKIEYSRWDFSKRKWLPFWSEPEGPCSVYKICGANSICKHNSDNRMAQCECLPGYEPKDEDKWQASVFSEGCAKNRGCVKYYNTFKKVNFKTMLTNTPTFRDFNDPTFSDLNDTDLKESKCISICQLDCACKAYSSAELNRENSDPKRRKSDPNRKGCWFWTDYDEIEGFTDDSDSVDQHILFIRTDNIEGASKPASTPAQSVQNRRKSFPLQRVVIATSVIFAVALLCCISYISYRRVVVKRKDQKVEENLVLQSYDNEDLIDPDDQFREDDKKDIDVPFFELETILAATDNFSQAFKLGQGGFGPVYKGEFPGGEEIAVKRLSSNSGQGLKEFRNEVLLIAKLQHRNLVRLLGYCMKGNEKILLYEYMPNRSLDAFIFDEKRSMLLDWPARFDIIKGVARGLLYLHQDSRLRIIHRDMKASNILLDEEMNPKISDFGLARIVGRRETESNTNRVIGTYGYMAPEYALEGQFSVMSDAFSFGVIVLEIISGKRNTGFYDSQLAMNLLGYAWGLWKKETPLALLDEKLVESCNEREVFKCIVIGLLCVQEDPNDRPNMLKVLLMLSSETENETLPNPKQPAFVTRKLLLATPSSSSTIPETVNEITFTAQDGR